MLRRANEHETAAFYLVERTMRRTRPRVGTFGLKAVAVPDGTIERNPLGRLRFRFDGQDTDFVAENGLVTRPISDDEATLWNGLHRLVSATRPVADSEWNLVSMRLGQRVLRRLPFGGVVTYVPNGTPPFKGSFAPLVPEVQPESDVLLPSEAKLLHAIDEFLAEVDAIKIWEPPQQSGWTPPRTERQPSHIISTTLGHGRHGRGKFYRCPICHTPVVKGLFNPRIPSGGHRPAAGAIRDLRGGYLSRLRETYLLDGPSSLLQNGEGPTEPRERPPSPPLLQG